MASTYVRARYLHCADHGLPRFLAGNGGGDAFTGEGEN